MMTRLLGVLALVCSLSGCASFQNRGGLTDWAEDQFVFKADSKEMRVLRSYVILGGLARISSSSPMTIEERDLVSAQIASAVRQSYDALVCAKSRVEGCVFFDDRMAGLDRSLLRLASTVLLPEENKDLMAIIQKEVFGGKLTDGLLGPAGKIISAAGEVGITAGSAVNIVGSFIELGRNIAKFGGRFAPIYRDSVELRVRVVIDGLKVLCGNKYIFENSYCFDLGYVSGKWNAGVGNLAEMDSLSSEMLSKYAALIRPDQRHFAEISDLIIRSCEELVGGDASDDEYSEESKKCAAWPTGTEKRSLIYYNKLEEEGWEARLQ